MKANIKNLVTVGILSSVLMIAAQTAKAGVLISDYASPQGMPPCTAVSGDESSFTKFFSYLTRTAVGIIINSDLNGVLVSDKTGVLVSDRSGVLISDRAENACQ